MLKLTRSLAVVSALVALAGCNDESYLPRNSRHYVPVSSETQALIQDKGMRTHSPILLRSYKQESELEVWKQTTDGKFALLKTYPMCRWSGQLGPKTREGDRQVPEGFYAITPAQMNPNSNYYLSFNVGYPNAFDRAHDRTGGLIMVHGACSSMGCLSMTDNQIADVYALTREAFAGGQQAIQMQSMPFRMNAENLAKFRADPNMPFWKNLKDGHDHFDVTKQEPKVAVCGRRYVFNATATGGARLDAGSACPPLQREDAVETAVAQKQKADQIKVAELVASGTRAVKRLYHDGDQHPVFKSTQVALSEGISPSVRVAAARVSEISRPEAVERGAVEIPVEDYAAGRAKGRTAVQIAESAFDRQMQAAVQAAVIAPPITPAAVAASEAPANAAPAATRAAAATPAATATRTVNATPRPANNGRNAPVAAAPVETAALAVAPPPNEPAFFQRMLSSVGIGSRAAPIPTTGP